MSSKEYLKRCEHERAEAKAALKAREDAADATIAEHPELYKALKQAMKDARNAFKEVRCFTSETGPRRSSSTRTQGRA